MASTTYGGLRCYHNKIEETYNKGDMMNGVEVMVKGCAGTGRSAIAKVIELALKEHGITVELLDDNGQGVVDELPESIEATLPERIKSFVEHDVKVKIKTCQCHRSMSNSL